MDELFCGRSAVTRNVLRNITKQSSLRDGPLENLSGGGGGGGLAKYKKKYSRKGKLNEKKFMHAN